MASLLGAKALVKYGTNLVCDFDPEDSCFGERSFYCCFGIHRLYLIENLTPLRSSPLRKRVRVLTVIAWCYYYREG
jgi:hypothetical protein